MKRVIAYAFFGAERRFPFDVLVRANQTLFPGWEMWVYHDTEALKLQGEVLRSYEKHGLLKLVYAEENLEPCRSMLWRLLPLWDAEVEYVLCRDLDSLSLVRDRQMVEEFVTSGAAVHCINDNEAHNVPMMGGMIGFNRQKFWELPGAEIYATWQDLVGVWNLAYKGADQELLAYRIWPLARSSLCEHRIAGYKLTLGAVLSKTSVPSQVISDIPPAFLEIVQHPYWKTDCPRGDSYSNYLGASGFRGDDALNDYQKFGTAEVLDKISKAEKLEVLDLIPRVIMGADTTPMYSFFLPLTATLWQRLGFQPLFILVGSEEVWKANPVTELVLRELKILKVDLRFIEPIEGFLTSTVAQVSRLYSACLGLPDEIYCLTSDADMWPISTNFWVINRDVPMQHWGFCGNSNHFICYEGATVANWRALMRLQQGVGLQQAVETQLKDGLGAGATGMNAWCYDENLLNLRLSEWSLYGKSQFFGRDLGPGSLPIGRVDRSSWNFDGFIEKLVDAHLVRPGHVDENWHRLFQLYRKVYSARAPWAEDYRNNFLQASK